MSMDGGQKDIPAQNQDIVQFKDSAGTIRTVNLGSLEAVFANIQSHNEQFSFGAMLAQGILSAHNKDGDANQEPPTLASALSSESDRSKALGETLGIIHTDSFSPIGISLDAASDTGARILTEDEEIEETQIMFGIQNTDLFLSFLKSLETINKEDLHERTISSFVGKVGYDLFIQIYQHYGGNWSKHENVVLVISKLDQIVTEYKKLGIKAQDNEKPDILDDLDIYSQHAKQGILQEYVKSRLLLVTPQERAFGPAEWQGDSTPKYLRERWEEAIHTLLELKTNPKANDLYSQVKSNLQLCLRIAKKDIESRVDTGNHSNDDKREVLQTIEERLKNI